MLVVYNLGAGGPYVNRLRFVGVVQLGLPRASAVCPFRRLEGFSPLSVLGHTVPVESLALNHVFDRFHQGVAASHCGDVHSIRIPAENVLE